MTESEIRADERMKCWREINALIEPGHLTGEAYALRDGLMMACNAVRVKAEAEILAEYWAARGGDRRKNAPRAEMISSDGTRHYESVNRNAWLTDRRKPAQDYPLLAPIDYAIGPQE